MYHAVKDAEWHGQLDSWEELDGAFFLFFVSNAESNSNTVIISNNFGNSFKGSEPFKI